MFVSSSASSMVLCGQEISVQRRAWQSTPVFLSGESHVQRNLMGYSSWGRKELYMTEQLNNKVFSARAVELLLLFSRSVMLDSLQLHEL